MVEITKRTKKGRILTKGATAAGPQRRRVLAGGVSSAARNHDGGSNWTWVRETGEEKREEEEKGRRRQKKKFLLRVLNFPKQHKTHQKSFSGNHLPEISSDKHLPENCLPEIIFRKPSSEKLSLWKSSSEKHFPETIFQKTIFTEIIRKKKKISES